MTTITIEAESVLQWTEEAQAPRSASFFAVCGLRASPSGAVLSQ